MRGVLLRDGRIFSRVGRRCDNGHFLERLGARRERRRIAAAATAKRHRSCWAINFGRSGLHWTRLKTGTPPRLDGRTIEWDRFEAQAGDPVPTPFSFMTERIERPQIQCHIAYTSDARRQVVRDSIVAISSL